MVERFSKFNWREGVKRRQFMLLPGDELRLEKWILL